MLSDHILATVNRNGTFPLAFSRYNCEWEENKLKCPHFHYCTSIMINCSMNDSLVGMVWALMSHNITTVLGQSGQKIQFQHFIQKYK